MSLGRLPSHADPRPLTVFEIKKTLKPSETLLKSSTAYSREKGRFVKSQTERDVTQRVSEFFELIQVDGATGIDKVCIYVDHKAYSSEAMVPVYIGFNCPLSSPFDDVNRREFQALMLQAQDAMTALKRSVVYPKISVIYYVSNGCDISKSVAERLSQIYRDKPSEIY